MRGLSEKEVEIEHLKTTVIALNEKVEVVNDLRHDVDGARGDFTVSETKRVELQVHIKETSIKIHEETEEHTKYQDHLISENDNQRSEIKKLNEH